MTSTLSTALRQIRDDLAALLEPCSLGELCRSTGLR